MLIIPIETPDHTADALILVLDDANLERMAAADPVEIILRETGRTLVNPTILVCHDNGSPELARLLNGRDLEGIAAYLTRGFKFRPDKGDRDSGPESLHGQN